MRRTLLAIVIIAAVACRQDRESTPASKGTALPAPKKAAGAPAPVAPPKAARSTPGRCAGDGSYADAVECFRATSRLDFSIEEAKGVRATGEMTRTTIGAEREEFTLAGAGRDDGEWSAEAKAAGVLWTHGGQRTAKEPPLVDRIWQRTTLYIDPQKKESEPQRDFTEMLAGERCIRYRFTDANNGDVHDVWVSTGDGHIVQIKVESHGAFPSYTMQIAKAGK